MKVLKNNKNHVNFKENHEFKKEKCKVKQNLSLGELLIEMLLQYDGGGGLPVEVAVDGSPGG